MSEEALLLSWNDFVDSLFTITEDLRSVIITTPTDSPTNYKTAVEEAFNQLPNLYNERFVKVNTMIQDVAIPASTQATMVAAFLQKLVLASTGNIDVNMDVTMVVDRATVESAAGTGLADRVIRLLSIMSSPDSKLILHESIKDVVNACISILKSHAASQALIKSLADELAMEKLKNDEVAALRLKIQDATIALDGLNPDSEEYNALVASVETDTTALSTLLEGKTYISVDTNSDLKAQIQAWEADEVLDNAEIATLKESKSILEAKINDLNTTIDLKKAALDQLVIDYDKLELEANALSAQNEELRDSTKNNTILTKQLTTLQETIASKDAEIIALTAQLSTLVAEHASAISALDAKHASAISALVAEHTLAISALDAKHASAISALETENAQHVEKLTVEKNTFEKNNAKLLEDYQRLVDTQATAKNTTTLQADNLRLSQSNTALTNQVNTLQSNVQALQTQLTELKNTTVSAMAHQIVVTERDTMRSNVSALTLSNIALQRDVESKNAALKSFIDQVAAEKAKAAIAEKLYQDAQATMQNLQAVHISNTQIIDNFDMRNMNNYQDSVARKVAMIKLERLMTKIAERVDKVPATADAIALRTALSEIKNMADRAVKNDFDPVKELETLVPELTKMINSFEEIKDRVTSMNENFSNSMNAVFRP